MIDFNWRGYADGPRPINDPRFVLWISFVVLSGCMWFAQSGRLPNMTAFSEISFPLGFAIISCNGASATTYADTTKLLMTDSYRIYHAFLCDLGHCLNERAG